MQSFSLLLTLVSITIFPDAHFLFNGEFKRSGDSLKIVGDDGKSIVIQDYFKADRAGDLARGGWRSVVRRSRRHARRLARAHPVRASQWIPRDGVDSSIGSVDKIAGSVTVLRNGVAVTLNVGDQILKSDVVQTGAGSSVSIVLIDGTLLNLGAATRMAMNEFAYDANSNANVSLLNSFKGRSNSLQARLRRPAD